MGVYVVCRPVTESNHGRSSAAGHSKKVDSVQEEGWQLSSPLAVAHSEDSLHKLNRYVHELLLFVCKLLFVSVDYYFFASTLGPDSLIVWLSWR